MGIANRRHDTLKRNQKPDARQPSSLLAVAGEQWLGSLCDHFVVSLTSGLGVQAAFRSGVLSGRLHVLQNRKDNAAGAADAENLRKHEMKTSCWPAITPEVASRLWSEI